MVVKLSIAVGILLHYSEDPTHVALVKQMDEGVDMFNRVGPWSPYKSWRCCDRLWRSQGGRG